MLFPSQRFTATFCPVWAAHRSHFAMSGVLGIHVEWEKNHLIRRRFQRETSWLQWPALPQKEMNENEEEPEEEVEKQPICTKSLELNVEPITILTNYLHGNFANIDALKKEAMLADPNFFFSMKPLIHIFQPISRIQSDYFTFPYTFKTRPL